MLDNKKIGQRILSLRKHSNLTQMQLSEIVGVSHQAISKWENGECLPDIEVLLRLTKVFNLSVEGILLFDTKVNMYRGLVVTYGDATYYCEYSANKKATSIQEATVFPNLDKRWMTPKDIKIPTFFLHNLQSANDQSAQLLRIEYEVTNIQLKKVSMLRGFVVKYSDATYFCEYSENKKTTSIQEATVFPKADDRSMSWMTRAGIEYPNVELIKMASTSTQNAELLEIEYEVTNIQLKDSLRSLCERQIAPT